VALKFDHGAQGYGATADDDGRGPRLHSLRARVVTVGRPTP
jgi:hypothetical protein